MKQPFSCTAGITINSCHLSNEQFSNTFETSFQKDVCFVSELKIPLLEIYRKEIIEDVRNDLFSRMFFVVVFIVA